MTSHSIQHNTRQTVKKAVVLLSGGLDSYTCAGLARESEFDCYALTVNYNQRHSCELDKARQIAEALSFSEHKQIDLDLRIFGGSALTADVMVPKNIDSGDQIPITYVPARNTIMLSLALGWAEVLGAFDIFIGANAVDYSGYPDCRSEYLGAFESLANLATKAGVEKTGYFQIHAPLLHLSKAQIILEGMRMGLDYSLTHSCYDPDLENRACGQCDSCRLRLAGFAQVGIKDPIEYVNY